MKLNCSVIPCMEFSNNQEGVYYFANHFEMRNETALHTRSVGKQKMKVL